ncbi:MAG: hypothetical protein D3910_04275 [Candidatus Electrothrix sp. ATG2]|nr:hypothetical protein [Candidatus Electrothrix sp. ATG2]
MKSCSERYGYGILGKILLSVFVCMLPQVASAARRPVMERDVAVMRLKPDIVISDIRCTKKGEGRSGADLIAIKVEVKNKMLRSSTGPFKVKIEWTENPTVGFTYLGHAGVTNLSNSGSGHSASAALASPAILNFRHKVPAGKAYKYKVTADYLNQVDENREDNNIRSAGYSNR